MKTLKIIKKIIFALFVLEKIKFKEKLLYIIIHKIMRNFFYIFPCFFLKQTMRKLSL